MDHTYISAGLVCAVLEVCGPSTVRELCELLKVDPNPRRPARSHVYDKLRELEARGRVRRTKRGDAGYRGQRADLWTTDPQLTLDGV